MPLLLPDQKFEKYKVQQLIVENSYCETYRVEDENEKPFFLKLFIVEKMSHRFLDGDGNVTSIKLNEGLNHSVVLSLQEHGVTNFEGVGTCQYIVTEYYAGELLEDKINRDGRLPFGDALKVYEDILNGLLYLHLHYPPLVHNDITPRNILLTDDGHVKIIDMGHLSYIKNSGTVPPFDTTDLDPRYHALETIVNNYNEKTDIFSATAVLYNMLLGVVPWGVEMPNESDWTQRMRLVIRQRADAGELDLKSEILPEKLKAIIRKGLATSYYHRYDYIKEILCDIEEMEPDEEEFPTVPEHKGPKGFEAIAGMSELKKMLNDRVLFLMKDKEKVEKYKLTPPNGMLLYGPPGCGKTFFAEKFAEECGYYFMMTKISTIGSTLVHGTEENIAKLFAEAEEHAPTVICFDEFDAFVPARTTYEGRNQAGEVNEFLTHLNNCGEKGIFVIATSNRPDMIDPAVLRTGRIDKQIFVPLPDEEARMEMFNLYLKDRPCEEIDTKVLAQKTEGYIASDISYICNETAMIAALNDKQITQEMIETTISSIRPSIRPDVIKMYDDIRDKMEGIIRQNTIKKIGFT